jgi:hypothetical protein
MRQSIVESALPKTFVDAITIARYLDIRYLWIDSLCIVQDDDQDWQTESAKMADIYQACLMTIAATGSSGADSGLFHDNPNVADKDMATSSNNPDHKGIFMASKAVANNTFHGFDVDPKLLTRGWVMQERLLSPRVLHFHHELVFECRREKCCECVETEGSHWPRNIVSKNKCDELELAKLDPEALYDSWHNIVQHYATLQLTYDTDVLPAISGLARLYQRYIRGRYIAGMWEPFLIGELVWKSYSWTRRTQWVRRSPWVAPSFSWASNKLSKLWPQDSYDPRPIKADFASDLVAPLWWAGPSGIDTIQYEDAHKNECDILDVTYTLAGPDPTGQITKATLILKGLLYPAMLRKSHDFESLSKYHLSATCGPCLTDNQTERMYPDYDYSVPSELHHNIAVGARLYCFLLRTQYDTCFWDNTTFSRARRSRSSETGLTSSVGTAYFLVLRKIHDRTGTAGVFERVGLMELTDVGGTQYQRRVPRVEALRGKAVEGSEIVNDATVWLV